MILGNTVLGNTALGHILLSVSAQLPVSQMFHPAFHFFLFTRIKWPCIWATQITTYPAGDRHFRWLMVAAFRAGKAFAGTREFTGEAAFIALINWRVGAVIRNPAVAVIPDVFQRPDVVLQIRYSP